jgi:hypothetical protein
MSGRSCTTFARSKRMIQSGQLASNPVPQRPLLAPHSTRTETSQTDPMHAFIYRLPREKNSVLIFRLKGCRLCDCRCASELWRRRGSHPRPSRCRPVGMRGARRRAAAPTWPESNLALAGSTRQAAARRFAAAPSTASRTGGRASSNAPFARTRANNSRSSAARPKQSAGWDCSGSTALRSTPRSASSSGQTTPSSASARRSRSSSRPTRTTYPRS